MLHIFETIDPSRRVHHYSQINKPRIHQMTYSTDIQDFLNLNKKGDHTGNLGDGLAEASIEQYGGEKAFLETWQGACYDTTNINGWQDTAEVVKFYNKNRDDILMFFSLVADEEGYEDEAEMIAKWNFLDNTLTANQVRIALTDTTSENHGLVAQAAALAVAQEAARYYKMFVDNKSSEK